MNYNTSLKEALDNPVIDLARAKRALKKIYNVFGLALPDIELAYDDVPNRHDSLPKIVKFQFTLDRPRIVASWYFDNLNLDLPELLKRKPENYKIEKKYYLWYFELMLAGFEAMALHPNKAFLVPRAKISVDDKNRLHSTTGPAVIRTAIAGKTFDRIPEKEYYIHGVKFTPKDFNRHKSLTAQEIIAIENQDRRRVLIIEYGNERLIKDLAMVEKSKCKDTSGYDMRILAFEFPKIEVKDWRGTKTMQPTSDPLVYLECVDPSKNEKVYLRVPPEFIDKEPWLAKTWTFEPLWQASENLAKQPELLKET